MSAHPFAAKSLAAGCIAVFFYVVRFYPFDNTWLAPILVLYAALLCWRPGLWLFALPAMLPALDLAPWTGWFYLEESDLLLLITAAAGYWHLPATPPRSRLPGFAVICAAAFTLATLIGLYRGLAPFAAPDASALASYLSPYNSLRVGKAWVWALILLPLLMRAAPSSGGSRLVPGMLAGLALVSAAALWERMLFPGLMNFSSDYRTTAPFSGMHTGGAALDGYLALSLPFLGAWLLSAQTRLRSGAALLLLGLGTFAALTTFSRGLYAGLVCAAGIVVLFLLGRRQAPRIGWRRALAGALLAALLVSALTRMFDASGYRGLTAAVIVLAAAAMLATQSVPWRLLPAGLLGGVTIELALALPLAAAPPWLSGIGKPPYLLYLLSALCFAGAVWPVRDGASLRRGGAAFATLAFLAMACNMLWIAWHWAGPAALGPGLLVLALALALIALNGGTRRRWWRIDRAAMLFGGSAALLTLLAIPIGASYYAGERFAGSAGDLRGRMRHWSQVLDMMDGDVLTRSLGMGLGRFPATYFWRNPLHELPPTLSYASEARNTYLRLTPPQYSAGYGELLRVLQRLALRPATRYLLELDVRRPQGDTLLYINLCARQLLYPQDCVSAQPHLLPPDAQWHHYRRAFDSAGLGAGAWPLRAPTQLELMADGAAGLIDVDNISVRAAGGGAELIRNGSFSAANDYWFFSSDHHHLPWHIKNFALNLYFEMGWFGLLALSLLLSYALLRLTLLARAGQPLAAVHLAALSAFLVVGLFDSLLDVPRLSLLFFLVLFHALLVPPAPQRHPGESP